MNNLRWPWMIVIVLVLCFEQVVSVILSSTEESERHHLMKAQLFNRKHPVLSEDPQEDAMYTFPFCLNHEVADNPPLEPAEHAADQETIQPVLNSHKLAGEWGRDCFSRIWEPKKTYVVFHGFMEHGNHERMYRIRNAHIYVEDVNVILIDWGKLSTGPFYSSAVENIRMAAEWTAGLIMTLVDNSASRVQDFHLVGFSLGAHVAGVTGQVVRARANRRLPHITGLDPAYPLVFSHPLEERLDKSDADFVTVLHTEIKFLGITEPVGHLDFYPNGGFNQPQCLKKKTLMTIHCGHLLAVSYYVESVYEPRSFPSCRCDSWEEYLNSTLSNTSCSYNQTTYMEPSSRDVGSFYLDTRDSAPYGVKVVPDLHAVFDPSFPNDEVAAGTAIKQFSIFLVYILPMYLLGLCCGLFE